MTTPLEFMLFNRRSEIARLQDELERLGGLHGLPARALHEVQLATEEHLTNILNHGYDDHAEHLIRVQVLVKATELCIEVEDEGRSFDPLKHPPPDLSQPLDKRPVGGLGIHMMRKFMDRIEYRRADGKNVLVMTKQFKAPTP